MCSKGKVRFQKKKKKKINISFLPSFFFYVTIVTELGINFDHILQKSLTVLNPFSVVDVHIMDDADLAGPLVFCFIFATLLLVVSLNFHYMFYLFPC